MSSFKRRPLNHRIDWPPSLSLSLCLCARASHLLKSHSLTFQTKRSCRSQATLKSIFGSPLKVVALCVRLAASYSDQPFALHITEPHQSGRKSHAATLVRVCERSTNATDSLHPILPRPKPTASDNQRPLSRACAHKAGQATNSKPTREPLEREAR